MNHSARERHALAHDLTAIYLAHHARENALHARENALHDHLAGLAGILLAGLVGIGPWLLVAWIAWNN